MTISRDTFFMGNLKYVTLVIDFHLKTVGGKSSKYTVIFLYSKAAVQLFRKTGAIIIFFFKFFLFQIFFLYKMF